MDGNRRGLFPGPEESDGDFYRRVDRLLDRKSWALRQSEPVPQEHLDQAFELTRNLVDIEPDWVPCLLSNEGLFPWHGGCALIDPPHVLIQVRRRLRLYRREELIAHELLHAARSAFPDGPFEEILAFQTSPGRLRRALSPILQSNRETLLFLGSLLVATAVDMMLAVQALYLVPALLLSLGLGRLGYRQRQFHRCVKRLKQLTADPLRARAVTFRLSDREIIRFSRSAPEQIRAYIEAQDSLRWRMIRTHYFDAPAT